tara:strand:+ start:568 stop:843 length:276 start_codon:yes stop_codon:yes gene_type:complete
MKQTINFSQFIDAFNDLRPNNFTYDGLRALFEYLEELEDSTGDEIEFDVIALCCDFTEYANAEEYARDYSDDLEDNLAATSDSGSLIVYTH